MENIKDDNRKPKAQGRPVIAITCGDPNGVGYEILLKAVSDPHITEICTPVIYGNMQAVRKHIQLMKEAQESEHAEPQEQHSLLLNQTDSAAKAKEGRVNLVNCYADSVPLAIGTSTPEAGAASLAALEQAVKDLKAGTVHALVTAPINKENIQSDQFRYSGHTEYLTHHFGEGHDSLMMMISDQMRVALVTNHVPLRKVAEFITEERILGKLSLLNQTLKDDFIIRRPRIAVLALNPHSGDNGLLGTEEKEIIIPAIEKAKAQGIEAFGPYSADGFFGAGHYRSFDAVLGMYHDQGLIPFKSLDMDGVNFTAGLDIIRTSPDHGTAYALAGKNQADAASMRNALYLAIDLLRTRAEQQKLKANPPV
ncbi:MAG: 4-hydroxythreonine-4-phosphate dehydrogenase PdxA [Paludibacteraceae bacterium]|nr:4-hydroxythreonine-4-phosphate dehydrogenase PdxA [Paludibacteraceae bacterium]